MALYTWTGSEQQRDQVRRASNKCFSVGQYLTVMRYNKSKHARLLKDEKYSSAFAQGCSDRIDSLLANMNDIIEDSSDRSAGARLDAIKHMLNSVSRRYSAILKQHDIDLNEGTIEERLNKVYQAYLADLLHEDTAKQLTTMLKTQHDIQSKNDISDILDKLDNLEKK